MNVTQNGVISSKIVSFLCYIHNLVVIINYNEFSAFIKNTSIQVSAETE